MDVGNDRRSFSKPCLDVGPLAFQFGYARFHRRPVKTVLDSRHDPRHRLVDPGQCARVSIGLNTPLAVLLIDMRCIGGNRRLDSVGGYQPLGNARQRPALDLFAPDSSNVGAVVAAMMTSAAVTVTDHDAERPTAGEADQARTRAAEQRYDKAAYELRGIIGTIRAVREQREYLLWTLCGGIFLGCLLWAILPGIIARALPDSWQMPEKIATRVLREPSIWEGGARLMRVGSPETWRAISDAAEMHRGNREVIDACVQRAANAKQPVRCTIRVRSGDPLTEGAYIRV